MNVCDFFQFFSDCNVPSTFNARTELEHSGQAKLNLPPTAVGVNETSIDLEHSWHCIGLVSGSHGFTKLTENNLYWHFLQNQS